MKFYSVHFLTVVALLAATTFSSFANAQVYTECTNTGYVALTFDEGPSSNLPQLIGLLRAGNALATFHFVARYLTDSSMRDFVKQVKNAGHEIGLRTDPKWNLAGLKPEALQKLIINSAKVFEKTTNTKVKFVRVPFDMNDSNVIAAIENAGYIVTKPNLDSQDYGGADTGSIVDTFDLAFTAAPEGSASFITVQRDAVANSVAAVPQIIASGVENGYKFVTLATCVGVTGGNSGGPGAAAGGDEVIVRRSGKKGHNNADPSSQRKRKVAKQKHDNAALPFSTLSFAVATGMCLLSMLMMQ